MIPAQLRLSLIAFLATIIIAGFLPAGELAIELELDSDNDYGQITLPSRILGIGIEDGKVYEKDMADKDVAGSKFTSLGFGALGNKLYGDFEYHGITIPFHLELEPEGAPNEIRNGMAFTGPAAWAVTGFWKGFSNPKAYGNWLKANTGGKEPSYEELLKLTQKPMMKHLLEKEHKIPAKYAPEDDKDTKLSGGDIRKCTEKGKAYPFPHGLGKVNMYKYWNSAFAEVGAVFDVYPSKDWTGKRSTKGAERHKLGMVIPTGKTYLCAYFRNCSVMKGEFKGMPIILFDDNFNGKYGEVGIDSIRIGDSISTMGEKVFFGGKLAKARVEHGTEEGKLFLAPDSEEQALVRCRWNNSLGADLVLAIIKSGNSYFSLANISQEAVEEQRSKNSKSIVFDPVIVPAGKVEIVGGLVRYQPENEDFPRYVSFTGGTPIETEHHQKYEIKLGEPLEFPIGFGSEDAYRIISLKYPVGAAGETYRWFTPRMEDSRMMITGNDNFKAISPRGISKLMRLVDDGEAILTERVKYDDVLFAPENGPFKITINADPKVFPKQDATLERKTLAE